MFINSSTKEAKLKILVDTMERLISDDTRQQLVSISLELAINNSVERINESRRRRRSSTDFHENAIARAAG